MLEKSGSPSAPPPHEGEGETEFVGSGNVRVSLTHREIVAIYLCLLPGFFIGALNQTIVATALPTIGAELRDAENLAWVVLSYLITATVVSPLFGKLADIYGRHTMLVAALAVFLVGSIACALAPSMLFLVLARALQGIGAGGIMPVTQTLIADIVTPRQRGRYQSYTSLVWVIGGFLGPVLGGVFAERWHWSLVFWVNVPVAILAIALVSTRLGKVPQVRRKHTLDPLGGMLLVTAAVLVMLILTWGGTRFPWISTDMAMLTAATLAFLVAFASRMLTAEHPFLPITMMANSVARYSSLMAGFTMGTVVGLSVYMPLYFQAVHGLSAAVSGLALSPLIVGNVPGAVISGRVMMYARHYKMLPLATMPFAVLAMLVPVIWPHAPLWLVLTSMATVGFCSGTSFPISTVALQQAVEREHVGTATGMMNFFRSIFGAVSVAIISAIILGMVGVTAGRGEGVSSIVATAAARGVDMALVFRWVFGAMAVFLAAGVLSLILMEERPLHGRDSKSQLE